MSDRKAELEKKRRRLEEIKRAREEKKKQEQEQSKTAAAPKGGASATSASTESKETDIERKKREADELLKGIIPDDVIDGTAVSPLIPRSTKSEGASPGKDVTSRPLAHHTYDMAEEALRSTSLRANFHRLTRLLMRGGVQLLRETLNSICSPADLHFRLANPATWPRLKKAGLTQPERVCLYPSPGMYGKSDDFDITLIFKLFRTICGLTPPPGPRGWDDLPNSSDHSLVADLVRIKYYRNEIYAHLHGMEISDTEFGLLWEEIKETLLRIATNISSAKRDEWEKSINDLLRNPLTPDEERCIEELEIWYKQDMDVKDELVKLREELNSLKVTILDLRMNLSESRQAAGSEPPDLDIWNVILSFKESVDLFFRYLWCKLHLSVRNNEVGSWHITVECSSLQILEGLWEDYRSGHLNSVAQVMLITPQVLQKLGLTELELKTHISEDQYEQGKKLLEASSGAEDKSEIQALQATLAKSISEGSIKPEMDRCLRCPNLEMEVKYLKHRMCTLAERRVKLDMERMDTEIKDETKITDLERTNRIQLDYIEELKRTNEKIETKKRDPIEEKKNMKKQIADLKAEKEELKLKLQVQTDPGELDQLKTQNGDLLSQIEELKRKVKSSESECKRLQEELKKSSKFRSRVFLPIEKEFTKNCHGVIWFLKRDSSTSTKLLASRSSEGPGKASDIFDHQKGTISGTEEKEGSWWSIDLGPSFRLAITHYSLRQGQRDGASGLTHWKLEGSNDEINWKELETIHNKNDEQFTAPLPFYTGTWSVGGEVGAFRHFRIFQTGRNSSHKYGIYLSGIELFGMLLNI